MRLVAFQWYSIAYFMAKIKHKKFPFEALCKTSITERKGKKNKQVSYIFLFYFSDTLATA